MSEGGTVERALSGLKVTIWAFDQAMDPYFAGEVDPTESRTWEQRLQQIRRVLLKLANDIVDLYGPVNDSGFSMRASLMWELHADTMSKYGVVLTEDGKLFTLEKRTQGGVENAD